MLFDSSLWVADNLILYVHGEKESPYYVIVSHSNNGPMDSYGDINDQNLHVMPVSRPWYVSIKELQSQSRFHTANPNSW